MPTWNTDRRLRRRPDRQSLRERRIGLIWMMALVIGSALLPLAGEPSASDTSVDVANAADAAERQGRLGLAGRQDRDPNQHRDLVQNQTPP
jgi:hypothetical protein